MHSAPHLDVLSRTQDWISYLDAVDYTNAMGICVGLHQETPETVLPDAGTPKTS